MDRSLFVLADLKRPAPSRLVVNDTYQHHRFFETPQPRLARPEPSTARDFRTRRIYRRALVDGVERL